MLTLEYERPYLYDKQKAAIFNDARFAFCEASTKAGKTYACITWLFEESLKKRGNYWWMAPTYSQSNTAFERLERGLKNIAENAKLPYSALFEVNLSKKTLRLANGSTFHFKSGERANNLYGEDVMAIVIDETSRLDEDILIACVSLVTATAGKIRVIGNVIGRKNWFYKLCRRIESGDLKGDKSFYYSRLTAEDAVEANIIKPDVLEDAKKMMSESKFRELYFAEARDDSASPFGLANITKCMQEQPPQDMEPVVFGVDLAQSVDYTVIIGLNKQGDVVKFERFNKKDWSVTEDIIFNICANKVTYIDATGVGKPIAERLSQRSGGHWFQPFVFSKNTKQDLLTTLERYISSGYLSYPAGQIVDELEAFEINQEAMRVFYTSSDGMHDDCVMALALAALAFDKLGYLGYSDKYINNVRIHTQYDDRGAVSQPNAII